MLAALNTPLGAALSVYYGFNLGSIPGIGKVTTCLMNKIIMQKKPSIFEKRIDGEYAYYSFSLGAIPGIGNLDIFMLLCKQMNKW